MRRPSKLCDEVQALVDSGDLHPFDAEWIGRLPPDKQVAAAEKTIRNFGLTGTALDSPRSPIGGHNGPRKFIA